MKLLAVFAVASLLAGRLSPVFIQARPDPAPSPVADVRVSPARSYSFYFAVLLPDDRYVVRDATMVDLIASAYGIEAADVQGGPRWLERDRFDIVARLPANASRDDQQRMLRALLAQRFHLTLDQSLRPMPAYILTADREKLKPADAGGDGTCHDQPQPAGSTYRAISCRNISMDDFVRRLRTSASNLLDQPVINSTGLPGNYDFELKWTARRNDLAGAEAISIFSALDEQLGLKLTLSTAPRRVAVVASVLRAPTPNPPDLDKLLPPPPLPQFEVATIKPSKPDTHGDGRISGDGVNFRGITLKDLICLAWDLNEDRPPFVNAPSWLGEERFDIMAKVAPNLAGRPAGGESNLPMDIYQVELMLRALLVERFQIKAHMEDRPIDSYELVAAGPKLKASDPAVRTSCKEGPGADGKDPRIENPVLNRLVSCRNITMPELCDELQRIANGYVFNPIADKTGLTGAYDVTLSFTGASQMQRHTDAAAGDATDPSGALSLFDALKREPGLKLVEQRRPLPALVIDHIERKPTEN